MQRETAEVLAVQVERWRQKREISTTKLAKRAGMSYRTLNNILNPERDINPGLDKIEKLANALDCAVGDLLSPLTAAEEALLAQYRESSDGRRASVRALLAAPADPGEVLVATPDQERYNEHIVPQQEAWRRRDRLALKDKSDPRQRDLLKPKD